MVHLEPQPAIGHAIRAVSGAGYWAEHERFLRPDDIVLITAELFTLEIALGEPDEEGGFATRLLAAQWHAKPGPRP